MEVIRLYNLFLQQSNDEKDNEERTTAGCIVLF